MSEKKETIIIKLQKDIYKGINLFEIVLFSIFSTIAVLVFLYSILSTDKPSAKVQASYIISLIDIPMGIIASTTLSKKSKYSPIFLIIDAFLYGISNFLLDNNALGFVNAIIIPLLWFFAFAYLWKGSVEKETKKIETRKLNLSTGALLLFSVIVISTSLALVMHWNSFNSNDPIVSLNIWFDSFAASLMLFAVIMGVLRFREVWYLYLLANILKITLFTINLSTGNSKDAMLLVMSSAYLINAIFGLFVWTDSKKFDNKKDN